MYSSHFQAQYNRPNYSSYNIISGQDYKYKTNSSSGVSRLQNQSSTLNQGYTSSSTYQSKYISSKKQDPEPTFKIREIQKYQDDETYYHSRGSQYSSNKKTSQEEQNQEERKNKDIYGQYQKNIDSESILQKKQKSQYGITGLNNIGNTCFMNSALQCLFALSQFNDFFLQNSYERNLNPKHKQIAREYASLLQNVRRKCDSQYSRGESTHGLKRVIERVSPQFSGYSQQDSQEFLRVLLDGLGEDLNRNTRRPTYQELTSDTKKSSIQQISDEWFNYYKKREDSVVQDFFCGQMMNKVICQKCKNESLAFDNFLDLSLSFTKGLQKLQDFTLERMLDNFLKEEKLDDEYHCEQCKKSRESTRKFVIWKLPRVLVIHLKRFKFGRTMYGGQKLSQAVSFPIHNLDLSQFVQESNDLSVKDCQYHLTGIVNHSGSLYGGHYTADCMNPYDNRWYRFNDSSVHEIDIKSQRYDSTGSSSPYILFYTKKGLIQH